MDGYFYDIQKPTRQAMRHRDYYSLIAITVLSSALGSMEMRGKGNRLVNGYFIYVGCNYIFMNSIKNATYYVDPGWHSLGYSWRAYTLDDLGINLDQVSGWYIYVAFRFQDWTHRNKKLRHGLKTAASAKRNWMRFAKKNGIKNYEFITLFELQENLR